MVNKSDLLKWIKTLDDESMIGIDAGGLCLREILEDNSPGSGYYEIGGIPEECEP